MHMYLLSNMITVLKQGQLFLKAAYIQSFFPSFEKVSIRSDLKNSF